MKKTCLTLLAAITAATAFAGAASAQPYGPPPGAPGAYGAPGGWDIDHRIHWTQDRIRRGRDTGALDRGEFYRIQGELNGIRREAQHVRFEEGGRIDEGHRLDLEGKLDRVNNQIHWIHQMDEHRPW